MYFRPGYFLTIPEKLTAFQPTRLINKRLKRFLTEGLKQWVTNQINFR
jgi:hypothetical protein